MATMTELDKLRALLPHWIEHNAEHAAEFRNWAEKARATGWEEVLLILVWVTWVPAHLVLDFPYTQRHRVCV
jgi:hypothetical protein